MVAFVHDIVGLLHASMAMFNAWMAREGVIVLGIEQEAGIYLGAPRAGTTIMANDVLLLYGRGESLQQLDGRPRGPIGDEAHEAAVRDHTMELTEQVETERLTTEQGPGRDVPAIGRQWRSSIRN